MSDTTTSTEIVLPGSANPNTWTGEQRALMEFAGAAVAPVGVAQAFIHECQRTGLDPFAKQIYVAQLGGKWGIIVGVDGFRVIAQRSKGYRGQRGPQFTADGVTWTDAWLPQLQGGKVGDPPAAARVGVLREGFTEPVWQVVTWAEFGQTRAQWKVMPAHMLGIRAETHALRRTFPNDLSGLYTPEDADMNPDEVAIEQSRPWADLIDEADDKAVLAQLLADMKSTGEWSQELNARLLARAGVVTKDSRPPKEETPTPAPEQGPQEDVYEADGTPTEPTADAPQEGYADEQAKADDAMFPTPPAGGYAPGNAYAQWQAEQQANA